jgi:hypothetical protein
MAPIAHLTGTAPLKATRPEVKAIRAFVEAGGVLLIDSTGGSRAFADSVPSVLSEAFPAATLNPLPNEHPLLSPGPPGMEDLRKPRLRRFALDSGAPNNPVPQFIRAGKGIVLFTPLDLTSGLLGTETWGIFGYDPAYAQSLMKNLLFWTLDGQPE